MLTSHNCARVLILLKFYERIDVFKMQYIKLLFDSKTGIMNGIKSELVKCTITEFCNFLFTCLKYLEQENVYVIFYQ
jgi:hypothetical protein